MKFIREAAYGCARYLTAQLNQNNEKRRVYYFGFQVLIGSIVKIFILVALSMLFGTLLPTMVSVLVFGTLRVFAGGYHMDSYGKCLATSISIFVAAGLIVQYTYEFWSLAMVSIFLLLCFSAAVFIVLKWAPGDTPNKPITKLEDIKKFKRISFIYTFIWFIVSAALLYYKLPMLVLAGCFGLLFEVFSISPSGHAFFEMIRDGINNRKYKRT